MELPKEPWRAICPNLNCHRKIEEPVLLNNLSITPAEQYYACPHCFMKLNVHTTRVNLGGLFLTVSGLIILAWVSCLTIQEMTLGNRDIVLIFFGLRTGEIVGLGIGMKVVYYFLIGVALFFLGLCTFLRRRSESINSHLGAAAPEKEEGPSECPYHFSFLKKFDQNTSIPDECLRCSRMLECFGARTYNT